MFKAILPVFVFLLSMNASVAGAGSTNWQDLFNVPSITLSEIEKNREDIILVDVRSRFFAERKPVTGAQHISYSSRMFTLQMQALRDQNLGKKIVVYCNSDNCIRAYQAVKKCLKADIKNIAVFDKQRDMFESDRKKLVSRL